MQQNNSTPAAPSLPPAEIGIISKQSLPTQRKGDAEPQVSVLPLESLKLQHRQRRQASGSPQGKYLHVSKSKSPNPTRVNSAKQLVFRGVGVRYASEQKGRQVEQTRMLARERRLNRAEIEKKIQGLVSPRLRDQHLYNQQQAKKFRRTEEKRLLTENKKFKRIKEKPDEQQQAIRQKIMRKLMDDPRHFLSGIAEKSEDLVSQLDLGESKGVSLFQQTISESVEETVRSQLQE